MLPPVIINCLPKAGTNLIKRLFGLLPLYKNVGFSLSRNTAEKCKDPYSDYFVGIGDPVAMAASEFENLMNRLLPNYYLIAHLPFREVTKNILRLKQCRMILLLRDPRDVICSFVFYVLRKNTHYLHQYFNSLPDMTSRLKAVIKGIEPSLHNGYISLKSIAEQFKSIIAWMQLENTNIVLFEHLIGEDGGGTRIMQKTAVTSILDSLGYFLNEKDKDYLCSKLYSKESATYRKGKIGDWRNYFSDEISKYFEEHSGNILSQYQEILEYELRILENLTIREIK